MTVEPRAVDPHCFDADPDPAQNLEADPDPDPGGGGGGLAGWPAKNVHPPWQNPRYAPAGSHTRKSREVVLFSCTVYHIYFITRKLIDANDYLFDVNFKLREGEIGGQFVLKKGGGLGG